MTLAPGPRPIPHTLAPHCERELLFLPLPGSDNVVLIYRSCRSCRSWYDMEVSWCLSEPTVGLSEWYCWTVRSYCRTLSDYCRTGGLLSEFTVGLSDQGSARKGPSSGSCRVRRRFDFRIRVTHTAGDGRKEGTKHIKTYSPSHSVINRAREV